MERCLVSPNIYVRKAHKQEPERQVIAESIVAGETINNQSRHCHRMSCQCDLHKFQLDDLQNKHNKASGPSSIFPQCRAIVSLLYRVRGGIWR